MLNFIESYIEEKISQDTNYIVCTFYDIRVKYNLSEEETDEFLLLSRNKLQNLGYNVYFTGAKYTYNNCNRTVQDNELLVAIKENNKRKTNG